MKKSMKTILVPLVSISLLGVAAASHAYGGGCDGRGPGKGMYGKQYERMGGPGEGMRIERLAQRLDLTDEQQAQVREIKEASREKHEALREKMQNNREAMREAIQSDNTASIRSLADQKGDLVAEMSVLKANDRAKIRAVLTPEQQQAFADMKKRGRGRR